MKADITRTLDPSQGIKPLDFGAGGITGSVDANGRLIALNAYHARHGYVTLTTADPFPEASRYDPVAVRAYRARLAALDGFGPHFDQSIVERRAFLLADAIPRVQLILAGGTVAEVTTWVCDDGVVQWWQIEGSAPRWHGRLSVQRCAYTQLTEGGPVEMPPVQTHIAFENGILTIENPALPWAVTIAGFPPDAVWTQEVEGAVEIDLPGNAGTTILTYGVGPDARTAQEHARRLAESARPNPARQLEDALATWQTRFAGGPKDQIVRRGLRYGMALAVPVEEGICILTDHMLLPLSWNRDAYYVARALLSWRADCADIVRRHLLWMFDGAERTGSVWGRCYLANGRIKDAAFQLDQQLFPLLELAEYVLETGDRATWDRLKSQIPPVIEALLARRATEAWLFPTDETPADDPVALPYHFSSHVLMWRTFRRLAVLEPDGNWDGMAEAVRAAVACHFITERGGQRVYAYATNGRGEFHCYHDANDVPLALAPTWGFVTADDLVWRVTVEFAFSSANTGGYYAGQLGSVHTRAPWPLGDVQEIIIARATDDPDRVRRAQNRLAHAAQWDGALPEAYDPDTGAVISRHWFAWPNAMLACVMLGAFDPAP